MLSRRSFLATASAALAAPAFPLPALAKPGPDLSEIMVVIAERVRASGSRNLLTKFDRDGALAIRSNELLLTRHPKVYDLRHFMTSRETDASGFAVHRFGEFDVHPRHRPTCSRWVFETDFDGEQPTCLDERLGVFVEYHEGVIRNLVDEYAEEAASDRGWFKTIGAEMCPYLPIRFGPMLVDPNTFLPQIQFWTAYGVIDEDKLAA